MSQTRWLEDAMVEVLVDPTPWQLPDSVRYAVENYWKSHGTGFFRGPVLSVRSVETGAAGHRIYAQPTDYAHYLFSRSLDPQSPFRVRVIFAAACLITADGCLLAGRMGQKTARPGWIQAIGGSADREDVDGGRFLPVVSALREAAEEVGENPAPSVCRVRGFTIDDGGRVAVAVHMALSEPSEAVVPRVRAFLRHSPEPELADVLAIPLGKRGTQWLHRQSAPVVEYLKTLVRVL